jgi:hypothetical protein
MKELDIMKRKTQQTMKTYWMENTAHRPAAGGCLDKGRGEIVDPGANKEAVFKSGQPDSQSDGPATQNDSLDGPIFVYWKKAAYKDQHRCFRSYWTEKWTVKTQLNF